MWCRQWEVISGEGATVREGLAPSSACLPDRLACGAVIQEERRQQDCVLFWKLSGAGPISGWLSVVGSESKELLVRRVAKSPEPDLARREIVRTARVEGAGLKEHNGEYVEVQEGTGSYWKPASESRVWSANGYWYVGAPDKTNGKATYRSAQRAGNVRRTVGRWILCDDGLGVPPMPRLQFCESKAQLLEMRRACLTPLQSSFLPHSPGFRIGLVARCSRLEVLSLVPFVHRLAAWNHGVAVMTNVDHVSLCRAHGIEAWPVFPPSSAPCGKKQGIFNLYNSMVEFDPDAMVFVGSVDQKLVHRGHLLPHCKNVVVQFSGAVNLNDTIAYSSRTCFLATSPLLLPGVAQGMATFFQTGAWLPVDIPGPNDLEDSPLAALVQFLEVGIPPVAIDWASVAVKDTDRRDLVVLAVKALEKMQQRAVIIGDWTEQDAFLDLTKGKPRSGEESAELAQLSRFMKQSIRFVKEAPLMWLFLRCSCVVHSGDLCRTHAALACGCPCVITPTSEQEVKWAGMVNHADVGVGLEALLPQLDPQQLASAIEQAQTKGPKAGLVGASLRAEGGAERAATLLHNLLHNSFPANARRKAPSLRARSPNLFFDVRIATSGVVAEPAAGEATAGTESLEGAAALEEYLQSGAPPVAVVWESMVAGKVAPAAMWLWALRALKRIRRRAVVVGKWPSCVDDVLGDAARGSGHGDDLEELAGFAKRCCHFAAGALPRRQILSRCSCVVHHGGAAITHSVLACGRPSVVTPLWYDQRKWAKWLGRCGVGVGLDPAWTQLDPEQLACAVLQAENMVVEARLLGEVVRAGGRTLLAARPLLSFLQERWLAKSTALKATARQVATLKLFVTGAGLDEHNGEYTRLQGMFVHVNSSGSQVWHHKEQQHWFMGNPSKYGGRATYTSSGPWHDVPESGWRQSDDGKGVPPMPKVTRVDLDFEPHALARLACLTPQITRQSFKILLLCDAFPNELEPLLSFASRLMADGNTVCIATNHELVGLCRERGVEALPAFSPKQAALRKVVLEDEVKGESIGDHLRWARQQWHHENSDLLVSSDVVRAFTPDVVLHHNGSEDSEGNFHFEEIPDVLNLALFFKWRIPNPTVVLQPPLRPFFLATSPLLRWDSQNSPPNVILTGAWLPEEDLPTPHDLAEGHLASLREFLAREVPTVAIGWGCPLRALPMEQLVLALRAVRRIERRAVFFFDDAMVDAGGPLRELKDLAKLEGPPTKLAFSERQRAAVEELRALTEELRALVEFAEHSCFFVAKAPLMWLLPQCSCVVHNGHPLDSHTALACGRPSVVTRSETGEFLRQCGVGVDLGQEASKIRPEQLASAILEAEAMEPAARRLRAPLRAERGAEQTAMLLQNFLQQWDQSGRV